MKHLIKTICLLLILCTLAFCTGSAFAADDDSPNVRLAVLGDSIASGYGLKNTLNCYASLVAKEKSYHLTNDAVPGHTTQNLLWVICNSTTAKKSIAKADVISVSICGNDMIQFLTKADTLTLLEVMGKGANSTHVKELMETITFNLQGVCTELRALNPDAPIIFQTQYNPLYASTEYSSFAPIADEFAPLLKEIFENLCHNFSNVHLIDVHEAFNNHYKIYGYYDVIQEDGIHPTETGHQLIASLLLDKVNELEDAGLIPKVASWYYLLGDADGNNRISVTDATVIQKITAGILSYLGNVAKVCVDADENGTVNIKDATSIQKHLADLPANPNIGTYLPYYEY